MLEFLNPYNMEGCIYYRGKWYRKGMERKEGSGPPYYLLLYHVYLLFSFKITSV